MINKEIKNRLSAWENLPTIEVEIDGGKNKLYRNQFITEGGVDITTWQLKKLLFWEYGIPINLQSLALGILGVPVVPSFKALRITGTFEYEIHDPNKKKIFWQRVYLANEIVIISQAVGGISLLSAATGIIMEDRTQMIRSSLLENTKEQKKVFKDLPYPFVRQGKQKDSHKPAMEITILTRNLPRTITNKKADRMIAEKHIPEKVKEGETVAIAKWIEIGGMVLEESNVVRGNLSESFSETSDSIYVSNIEKFPETGTVEINQELISYSGKGNEFLGGLIRGIEETKKESHSIGSAVEEISSVIYKATDYKPEAGKHNFYRIKAISSEGDEVSEGISVFAVSNNENRTRIETYIIDGKKTDLNPTTTPYDDFLTGAEIDKKYIDKLSPGKVEETFSAELGDKGFLGTQQWHVLIDGTWISPIYKMKIPNKSILKIRNDGFSYNTFMFGKGKGAMWQFRAKLDTEANWSIIKDVSGKMLSAQSRHDGIDIIEGTTKSSKGGTITSTRSIIHFATTASAFLFKSRGGEITVITTDNELSKLRVSSNGGITFETKKENEGNSPTAPIDFKMRGEKGAEDFLLFGGQKGFKIIDVTRDSSETTLVLAELNGVLFMQHSKDFYDSIISVGLVKEGERYRWKGYESESGVIPISVAGNTHYYQSSDSMKSWKEFQLSYSDSVEEMKRYTHIDSYRDSHNKELKLKSIDKDLYLDLPNSYGDNTVFVGQREPVPEGLGMSGDNKYKLLDSRDWNQTGKLTVRGQTHEFTSVDTGKTWKGSHLVYDGDV